MSAGLDPHGWARKPRSNTAMFIAWGLAQTDHCYREIVDKLIEDGVCDGRGRLLMRRDGREWRVLRDE